MRDPCNPDDTMGGAAIVIAPGELVAGRTYRIVVRYMAGFSYDCLVEVPQAEQGPGSGPHAPEPSSPRTVQEGSGGDTDLAAGPDDRVDGGADEGLAEGERQS
jgi:hypothetical protein